MSPEMLHKIAQAMLGNPKDDPAMIIECVQKYMPDFVEWHRHFLCENLTLTGVINLCQYSANKSTREITELCEKAMSVFAKKVKVKDNVVSYREVSNFVLAEIPDLAKKDAKKIAGILAQIVLSDEVKMLPSTQFDIWTTSNVASNEESSRNYCVYAIAMSKYISANLRRKAANDSGMFADLKRYGHFYQDKKPFAEAYPEKVRKIFPKEELGNFRYNTNFLQELCKVHGKKNQYLCDALAAKSQSKETRAILAELRT